MANKADNSAYGFSTVM